MKEHIHWYILNPKDGTELVLIPGGWFWMGSGDDDLDAYDSEKPRHLHYVKPFYFSITCVTVEQFGRFVQETGYKGGNYPGTDDNYSGGRWDYWKKDPADHPVRYINWYDGQAYGKWAGLRLPTEPEWELVARGYEALKYPWGGDWEDGKRVCWSNQKGPEGETSPVFDHADGVSPFGTFQQSGNVWEWCEDGWDSNVYQRYARGNFKKAGNANLRVVRGASWGSGGPPRRFRGADRRNGTPGARYGNGGLRLARTVIF